MSPTIIRHKATSTGFVQVISVSHSAGFSVWLQEYTVIGGRTTLDVSGQFTLESTAIEIFNEISA